MRPARGKTILIGLALGFAACRAHEARESAGIEADPASEVLTAEVARTGGAGTLAVPGAVQARDRATLAARVPGSVVELRYREGERVEAGAVVVRLDDAPVRAALVAAEAAVAAADADLVRTKTLLEKGAATPRELEQVTAEASAARARLTAARDDRSHAALRAPFAGRIAARRVNVGDVVSAGSPLVEVEGEAGLEVLATVEPEAAALLRPGAKLEALVDGQADALAATVTAVAPSGDPTTHRFEVRADLPAASGLRAGLFARLLVRGVVDEPRFTVPSTALFTRGGLTGVFVVSDGRARLRWVATGDRDDRTVEVRAGVEAGERVALDPARLTDGASVSDAHGGRANERSGR